MEIITLLVGIVIGCGLCNWYLKNKSNLPQIKIIRPEVK